MQLNGRMVDWEWAIPGKGITRELQREEGEGRADGKVKKHGVRAFWEQGINLVPPYELKSRRGASKLERTTIQALRIVWLHTPLWCAEHRPQAQSYSALTVVLSLDKHKLCRTTA